MNVPKFIQQWIESSPKYRNRAVTIDHSSVYLGRAYLEEPRSAGGPSSVAFAAPVILTYSTPADDADRFVISAGVSVEGQTAAVVVTLSDRSGEALELGSTDFWPRPVAGVPRLAVVPLVVPLHVASGVPLVVRLRSAHEFALHAHVQIEVLRVAVDDAHGGFR